MKRFYSLTFLGCVSMGLVLSLYVVYLHNVRHFSTGFATLLLSVSAIAGLVTSPLWGTMTDRLGPLPVLITCYTLDAVGIATWAFAHTRDQAIFAGLMLAVFGGAGWGPQSTLLTRLVPEEHRQRAFGFNFMLVNLGIGFGGLVSAAIVDLHHPFTFTVLYLGNASLYLVTGWLYLVLRKHGGPIKHDHQDEKTAAEGWGTVLRDTRLLRYVLATIVLMIGGYGSLDAGLSLFCVNVLKLPIHVIGVGFFFNTATIVLSQLWVLNRIEGKSRTRVLATTGALWASFWFILEITLHLPVFLTAIALFFGMVVFAVGETMMSPVGGTLINQIAPEHLRGRYNAAAGLSWGISSTLAPAITALYFANGIGKWWPLATGISALVGSGLFLSLRKHLSPLEDGREFAPKVSA